MDLENYLKERYIDFWSDIYTIEKDKIKALKKYIDYIEKNLRNFKITNGKEEWTEDLFVRKHLDYLQEAFSSLILGNYNAFGSMIRIIIENYVSFSIIKKYKKDEIWKDWYLWSNLKTIEKCQNRPEYPELKNLYKNLCQELGVNENYINDTSNYAWLKKITKKEHNSFKKACDLVDKEIYKDFEELSSYTHNNDLFTKFNPVLMEKLSKFIYQLYTYSDKFINTYKPTITNTKEYKDLCKNLLNSIDKCLNYQESI